MNENANDNFNFRHSDFFQGSILDAIDDVIAVFDTDLNYLQLNTAACKLLNKSSAEIIGKNILELFPTLIASTSHRCLLKALSGETILNAVSEGTFTREGANYLSNYSPVFKNGKVEAVVAVTKKMNLSDGQVIELLKDSKIKLLGSRITELEDFVENAIMPLHWVNGSGVITWANRSELEMMGYTKDEYIGRHIANFHVDAKAIDNILKRLFNKENLVNCPARLKTKSGEIKEVLINSNVFWREGEFIHTRCFTVEK